MNITIKNFSFSYENKVILHNISLEVFQGELLALIGSNGSGKTTFLRSISGLHKISKNSIYLGMKDLARMTSKEIAKYLAAIEPEIQSGFDYSVSEIVFLGRVSFKTTKQENADIVQESMLQTGVAKFAKKSIFQLSSGERQRVWLAMVLAQQPKILLLDEPTSYLDIKYQLQILYLLQELIKKNITVICSIHDLTLAAQFATRVAIMKQGQIVSIGSPLKVLTPKKLQENFGIKVRILQENNKILGVIPIDVL